MSECESLLCCSKAKYIDDMGNLICQECMEEEVECWDAVYEDFESIEQDQTTDNETIKQIQQLDI